MVPFVICGYGLTFLIAERMGLEGGALFLTTAFVGPLMAVGVGGVLGLLRGSLFRFAWQVEVASRPATDDGKLLHIDSAPDSPREPR